MGIPGQSHGHRDCNSHNYFGTNQRSSGILAGTGQQLQRSYFDSAPLIGLPKRLIWLGKESKAARLVDTSHFRGEYAALSYCWGGNATFMTDDSTLEQFKNEILVEKLPQTLRDAFELTRSIGLGYLWVDAICIVQGNKQEWEEESQKMGHIYANAKVVFSATSSAKVEEGMFKRRSSMSLSEDIPETGCGMRARRNLNHEIITSCRTKSNQWWEKHIEKTFPLLSRGWAFQERMLATRIVHFTPSELVWECQQIRRCECQIVESDLYPVMNKMSSALRVCLEQPNDKRGMRQMWREIVNSYSVRKLTRIEDKLPALSGIAALFKEISGDIYAAGLWTRALPFDLLWRCDQTVELQSIKKRSPTWSWISVDGAVKWPTSRLSIDEQPLIHISSTTYFEHGAVGVEFLGLDCELDGNDEYGRVRAARMKLRTRLALAKIFWESDEAWNAMYQTKWAVKAGVSPQAPFWPDLEIARRKHGSGLDHLTEELFVMEIMKPGQVPGSWEEALVVRLKPESQNEFERFGVAANVSPTSEEWRTYKSWFSSAHSQEVVLI